MNEVVSTPAVSTEVNRVAPKDKKGEPALLAWSGALLLALAGMFLWKDLALASEVLALIGAGGAAAFAFVAHKKEWPGAGPIALGLAGIACGIWYAATKIPITLAGAGVASVAALVLAVRSQVTFKEKAAQLHRTLSWQAAVINGLISTFGLYFLVFDATETSLHEFIARRVLLTLMWLVSGAGMVVWGMRREASEVRVAGFVALAAAMAKLLMYDLEHTEGFVRIAALAVGGVVLLGAGRVTALVGKGKVPA
jgi:hypothetical protein